MRASRFRTLPKRIRDTYAIWSQSGDSNTSVYLTGMYHGIIPRGNCTYSLDQFGNLVVSVVPEEEEFEEEDQADAG